jgi:putative transcriptional regulator
MQYRKNSRKANLSDEEFAELKVGAEEALAHAQGKKLTLRTHTVLPIVRRRPFTAKRIRSIRMRLNVSQPVFAAMLYVTKDTMAKWEQGLRKPSGSALRLLEIAEKQPELLMAV